MSNENDIEPLPQSKFEWRPEEVTVLSPEEADAVIAEYLESLLSPDETTAATERQSNADEHDEDDDE